MPRHSGIFLPRLKAMHHAKKGMGRRRRHRMGGALPGWLSEISNFFKKHKLISRAGNALSGVLPGGWGTAAGLVGKAANAVGYGRRRRHRRMKLMHKGGALRVAGSGALY